MFHVEKIKTIPSKYIKRDIRMTLDYPKDFEFFEMVIKGLSSKPLTFDNVLKFIYNNPEVSQINFSLDKMWKENQKKIKLSLRI